MPIYEYRCGECEKEIEAIQKFSDAPLVDCPSCGAPQLQRLLSQSSFALKGSGWYADGYGGGAKKKDDASASSSSDAKSGEDKKKKADGGETSSGGTKEKKDAPSSSAASSA